MLLQFLVILSSVLTEFCYLGSWVLMGSLGFLPCLRQPTETSAPAVPSSHAIHRRRAAQVWTSWYTSISKLPTFLTVLVQLVRLFWCPYCLARAL